MEFVDDVFEEFARCFRGEVSGASSMAAEWNLARSRLDYSVESLHTVDSYLRRLHDRFREGVLGSDAEFSVLYGGAYLGEVIRRNSDADWHWVDYDELIVKLPELKSLLGPRSLPTCAALLAPDEEVIFCVQKIERFIEEGDEHSLHYLASALGRLR